MKGWRGGGFTFSCKGEGEKRKTKLEQEKGHTVAINFEMRARDCPKHMLACVADGGNRVTIR